MHVFLLNLFLTFNQKLISHGEEARGGCIATRMYFMHFQKNLVARGTSIPDVRVDLNKKLHKYRFKTKGAMILLCLTLLLN